MKPLRNNVVVKLDDSLPTQSGIYIGTDISKWRLANDQIANRGVVTHVGPGKRHPKTGVLMPTQCKPGDVVRFSELQYNKVRIGDESYIIINDQDIVGIEE